VSESDLTQPRDQIKSGVCDFQSYFHRAQSCLAIPPLLDGFLSGQKPKKACRESQARSSLASPRTLFCGAPWRARGASMGVPHHFFQPPGTSSRGSGGLCRKGVWKHERTVATAPPIVGIPSTMSLDHISPSCRIKVHAVVMGATLIHEPSVRFLGTIDAGPNGCLVLPWLWVG